MNGTNNIEYKSGTAKPAEVEDHFKKCDANFVKSLCEKVNLLEYATKIKANAVIFEAWEKEQLVGLIAAYFNDESKKIGYITNVSIIKNFEGAGIGTQLLKNCINHAIENDYNEIVLEVNEESTSAIRLYDKLGFLKTNIGNGKTQMKLILKRHSKI